MKILKNNLNCELNIRTEKDFPTKGIEFIDITPLIIQKDILEKITNAFVKELKDKNIDYILAPEARGFLFGACIATKLRVGLVPIRKKGKLPPAAIEKSFDYIKEYGADTLEMPKLVDDSYKDRNFYLIDDIYATGNTLKSIENAVTELGGNVIGMGVVLNIKELNNNPYLFSIIDVNES